MSGVRTFSPRFIEAVSSQLVSAAVDLEQIGAELCLDDAIASAHINRLQGVDRLAQTLSSIASVISAADTENAARAIPLSGLQVQLVEALASDTHHSPVKEY